MTAAPDPKPKKVVNRSPEYPAMDLESAIAKAEILRGKEGFAYAAVSVAAGHWNYSAGSGSGFRAIAALRHYGLLEEEGSGPARRVRLTVLAKNILLDNREASAEKAAAIQQAALNPKTYRSLWALWGPSLPSNENMQYHLQMKLEFNAGAISGFIKDFRATVAFAKLGQGGDTSVEEGKSEENDFVPPGGTPKGDSLGKTRKETPMPEVQNQPNTRTWDLVIPLISGTQAILRVPLPLSDADYTMMTAMIDANLKGMKAAIVSAPPVTPPSVEEAN